MSEFDVNINAGNEPFIIKKNKYPGALTKRMTVFELKTLIQFEKKILAKNIILKYNGNVMNNDDKLKQYGIVNSQHLIEMICVVEQSKSYVNTVNESKSKNIELHVLTPTDKEAYLQLVTVLKSYEKLVNHLNVFLDGLYV